jgi:hypothetical protein
VPLDTPDDQRQIAAFRFHLEPRPAESLPLPRLTMETADGTFYLRWPTAADGFRLYSSDRLDSPDWRPWPAEPWDDGTWKTVVLPPIDTTGRQFFQLRKD